MAVVCSLVKGGKKRGLKLLFFLDNQSFNNLVSFVRWEFGLKVQMCELML